jgi:hypothetical protein
MEFPRLSLLDWHIVLRDLAPRRLHHHHANLMAIDVWKLDAGVIELNLDVVPHRSFADRDFHSMNSIVGKWQR